ncbi:MAG TPA: ABC transporter substrate-binding protein [Anaeromyxobacteraceae bacterium]|nr:ABC transporter substrate-binding protein [Anaeromyxobacteraceae bacterium]
MALIGDFNDTPFADLIQLYAGSGQTVAVTINLPQGEEGVFYVENGDIVDARLGDAIGRDAVRRAIRLEQGGFVVEQGVRAAQRTLAMPWRQLLMEEVVRMDEDKRRGGAEARRGGSGSLPLPSGVTPAVPKPLPPAGATPRTPKPLPLPLKGAGGGAQPPALRPPPLASASAAAASAKTSKAPAGSGARPASSSSSKRTAAIVAAVAVVLVVGAGAIFGLRARPATAVAAPQALAPIASADAAPTTGATVRFGMVSPFSGPDKELGRSMRTGVELAFAAANEKGGVHGRKLTLVALDDGNEPARNAEAMRELIEKRQVFAVVGNAGTATAGAAIPVALEHKVPFVGALGGGAGLRKDVPDRGVFVYRPGLSEETAAAIRYLVEVRRIDPGEIAFFGQDDDFGEDGWNGAALQLKSYGKDPAQAIRTTFRRNTADVDGAVGRLRKAGPTLKGVVMVASSRAAARLVEKVLAFAPAAVFTDTSNADTAQLAEELVGSRVPLADNVVVTQVVPLPTSRSSAVMRYRALLEKHALGEVPAALSMEGWVVGTLVVKALEAAGPEANPDKLVAALEGLHGFDIGVGVPLGFSKTDHQASHKVWGTALDKAGAWRQIDLE